jgi:hypothetical protein
VTWTVAWAWAMATLPSLSTALAVTTSVWEPPALWNSAVKLQV